jgi:HK97 family phage major capsid protein
VALNMISRDASNDPLVPTPVSAEVIKELPKSSAALSLCRRATMSSKSNRQPVLSVLPQAYWVSGDTGLKATSKADWENLDLVAEELAVIIPVPEAYFDDSQVPIWSEVRPYIVQAFGAAIDNAVLFGTSKPVTWTSPAIIPGAVAAGNDVDGTADLADDIAGMGQLLAEQGLSLRAFASEPGFNWQLVRARNANGDLIYGPGNLAQGFPASIYGMPNFEVENGSWAPGGATPLVGGDFNKAIIGMRQDITFKVFTEGVITDAEGVVLLNLMQQDSVALRVVMRCGYALANPVNAIEPVAANRFPFSTLNRFVPTPGVAAASAPKAKAS